MHRGEARKIPFSLVASATAALGFPAALAALVAYRLAHGSPLDQTNGSFTLLLLGAALGAVLAVNGLRKLPAHRRLLATTEGLDGRGFTLDRDGFVVSVTGTLGGTVVRASPREVRIDHGCGRAVFLDADALRDLAHGPAGVRPAHAAFAARAEGRRAAARLLEAGGRRVRVELAESLVRVSQLPSHAKAADVAVHALALALAPTFLRARAAQPGTCPYCKAATSWREDDGLFRCPDCESTHHATCWREHGGCAIHGCRRSPRREGSVAPHAPPGTEPSLRETDLARERSGSSPSRLAEKR